MTPLRSKKFQPRRLRLSAVTGAALLAGIAASALYGGLQLPHSHFNIGLAPLSVLIVGTGVLLVLGYQAQRTGRERLALQRARLERVLESADLGSWELDLHSGQVSLSPRAQEILGVQKAEGSITQAHWISLIHPQDIRRVREAFAKLGGDSHQLLDIEYRIRPTGGKWIWVASRGRAVQTDPSGVPQIRCGTLADVSARRCAEEIIQRSEQRLRVIADSIPVAMSYANADGQLQLANRSFGRLFGDLDRLIGRTMREILGEARYGQAAPAYERVLRGEPVTFERVWEELDGTRYFEVQLVPDFDEAGHVQGFYGMSYDISERKALENQLRAAHNQRDEILNNIPAMVAYWDKDHINRFANRAYAEYLGTQPEVLKGKSSWEFLSEQGYRQREPYIQAARKGEITQFELTDQHADGTQRNSMVTYVPAWRDDRVDGIYTMVVDITKIRALEEKLRISEARFREMATLARVGIIVTDLDGGHRYCNPRFHELTGLPPEETVGRSWKGLFPRVDWKTFLDWRERTLESGYSEPTRLQFRHHITGQEGWLVGRSAMVRKADGQDSHFITTLEDISELTAANRKLQELAWHIDGVHEQERRRLSIMLHEGLAQDLLVVKLNLDMATQSLDVGTDPRERLRLTATKLATAVASLRELNKDLRPADIEQLSLLESLQQLAGERSKVAGLTIQVHAAADFPPLSLAACVNFYRAAQEAITNVIRHARARSIHILLSADQQRVQMRISDDGLGMQRDDRRKSGALGLLGIEERFRARGGELELASSTNGTSLCVYLPRSAINSPDEFAARLTAIDALERDRALTPTSAKGLSETDPESPGPSGSRKGLH
ncbi:MAG: PAS domain S-box protein [Steroidobacteraceae bacterium]